MSSAIAYWLGTDVRRLVIQEASEPLYVSCISRPNPRGKSPETSSIFPKINNNNNNSVAVLSDKCVQYQFQTTARLDARSSLSLSLYLSISTSIWLLHIFFSASDDCRGCGTTCISSRRSQVVAALFYLSIYLSLYPSLSLSLIPYSPIFERANRWEIRDGKQMETGPIECAGIAQNMTEKQRKKLNWPQMKTGINMIWDAVRCIQAYSRVLRLILLLLLLMLEVAAAVRF